MALDPPPMEDAAAMNPARIVVRAPNWLGDCVLSLPALRDLRRNFPQARLEVLARHNVASLYEAVTEVDDVRESGDLRSDVATLRGAFDAAVVLPNSFGSALPPAFAGVPERWGYATDGRGPLLTRRPRPRPEVRGRSEVYYYRAMLAGIGLRTTADPDASLRCPDEWQRAGTSKLGHQGPWIGINPGAFYGSAKRWLPARYAAVADITAARLGARVVVIGAAPERPLGEAVAATLTSPVRILCGETNLREMIGVLASLRLFLTNDSGPMHIAAALGVPLVAVFGPTDWRETAPFGPGPHAVVREDVPCAPCKLRDCPIDHACMTGVSVDRVLAEVDRVLA